MVRLLENNVAEFQTKCGQAIEMFLAEVAKKSKHTERNYRGDIRRFLKITYNKTIKTITEEELDLLDFESFTQYVDTFEKVRNNTINRHISTIKELYRHLKARNILKSDVSYLDFVSSLPNDGTEIEHMPIEVVDRYISETSRELHNAEVKEKLVRLAADQGLRLSELLSLTWRSFVPREDGVVIKGYGKGNKKFTKKISYEVYEDLLKLRKGANSDSKVFSPLSAKNVTDMMIRIRKNLGYEDKEYSFHSLRKSAVTYFHRANGGNLVETQRFAGHSSPSTTQIYIGAEEIGVTGMYSTRNHDPNAYKKVSHEELITALEGMSGDFLHILNAKIQQNKNVNK